MAKVKPVPCGLCFEWVLHYAHRHPDAIVVHGRVAEPFARPPHRYDHAWVEHRGLVKDWQTMVVGHGGPNFAKRGYPIPVFYELYRPTKVKRYTQTEALIQMARSGHKGPW